MHKTHARRQKNIKTKLMAAICMLLVSSIMMVSTTYAWFTLSTAPEVTGINTAVGANGNLEMALLPISAGTGEFIQEKDYGITSSAGDSTKSLDVKNVTWGNLVDLSYAVDNVNYYGLDKITLFPSKLAVTDAGTLDATILQTPAYGADGRVSELKSDSVTSLFDFATKSFPQAAGYGVRAVGTASGMTDRQIAYRNARSAANTSMSMAKTLSSESLNTNGASLANIAVSHAANQGSETYTDDDIDNLLAIIYDLLGTPEKTGIIQHIENAYRNYIIAFGASQAAVTAGLDDTEYQGFASAVNGAADVYAAADLCAENGVTLPASITTPLGLLEATKKDVSDAKDGLEGITKTEGIAWSEFDDYLALLADMNAMEINGYAASTFRENMSNIINKVTSEGLTVAIASGGGVYADVADHCGNFTASITIDRVEYNGMVLENMNARMVTRTTVNPVYLSVVGSAVELAGSPTGVGGQVMPVSDFYGYIIDLAFKTNAASSDLLLQTEAKDRIYTENTAADAETMGHGASMTFTSTTTDFTVDQMKNLMESITVVFFDPMDENKILGTAKLDMADGQYTVTGGNTITAKLYLYGYATTVSYAEATAEQKADTSVELYTKAADSDTYTVVPTADRESLVDGTTYYVKVTTTGTELVKKTGNDAVITSLTQNTATAVSVLVYLDGETIRNADVAATAATSMTGTMNLQFSSSAALDPMDYTPLMPQGTPADGE